VGYLPTSLDIIDNPKHLKIVEVDTPQLTRTLDDPNVALSIINTNFSAQAGLSAARDGLFMEGPDSPYVNAIVSREENKDSKKIQQLKEAFQTKEVADKAMEVYKGDAIKGW
jgi:D-methionine transport system substrate-binding protein